MLSLFFHNWERRLADVSKDRIVRPFQWGLDWLPEDPRRRRLGVSSMPFARTWTRARGHACWFTPPPTDDYGSRPSMMGRHGDVSDGAADAAPSKRHRRHAVLPRTSRARAQRPAAGGAGAAAVELRRRRPRRAVPAARAIRHQRAATEPAVSRRRMPPELQRADYIVSSNVVRTLAGVPQAVLDARRAIAWLARSGYERIGILGTSLGSCLSMLTACHEPRIRAQALNHVSPYFADVVWRGLSTRHVRDGLEGHIDLETLRELWMPISPQRYIDRLRRGRDDAAGLRAIRPDVSGRSSRALVNDFAAAAASPAGGSAVRPLQHGHRALQVHGRRGADAISLQELVSVLRRN